MYIYIKCLKIYQLNNIEKIKKDYKSREKYQNLSKEEKKSDNMVVNVTKISQKFKSLLSREKIL